MIQQHKQIVIVTGATGAIGSEIAKSVAECGYCVVLAVRNINTAVTYIIPEITATTGNTDLKVMRLDLCLDSSIEQFADEVKAFANERGAQIVGLVNNAGIMMRHYQTCANGHEKTFQVNYLGTRRLTELLLPVMPEGAHIVFTTSLTRLIWGKCEPQEDEHADHFSQLGTYARSKVMLTRYAAALSRTHRHLIINCADPGVVNTNMLRMDRWFDSLADVIFRPFTRTARTAARASMRALMSPLTSRIYTVHAIYRLDKDEQGKSSAKGKR